MYGQPPLIIITAKWTKLLGVIVNSKHTRLIKAGHELLPRPFRPLQNGKIIQVEVTSSSKK